MDGGTRELRARAFAVLACTCLLGGAVGVALVRLRAAAMADLATSEAALLASAWCGAVAVWGWLCMSILASWLRRTVRAWRRMRWLDIATPASLRAALDRLLVVTIAASATLPMRSAEAVGAAAHTRRTTTISTSAPPYVRGAPRSDRGAIAPFVRGAPRSAPPVAPSPPAADPVPRPDGDTRAHVVVRGDNLWTIAAAELARRGLPHDNASTAAYWRRVIDLNRHRLRSGNPNLIFPGEVVALP